MIQILSPAAGGPARGLLLPVRLKCHAHTQLAMAPKAFTGTIASNLGILHFNSANTPQADAR